MPATDVKLLRDQLAQVIGENRRQAAKLEENETKNAELALAVDRILLEMGMIKQERDEALAKVERLENALREVAEGKIKAERILEYYDNAHTPPSSHTITQREINEQKSEERKKNNPTGRKGRHKGCKNTAVSRKAAKTVRHRPGKCGECGSPNLEAVRTDNKIVVDIPTIPKVEVVNHRTDTCRCLDCGGITIPETGLVRGTSLGPNLLKMVVGLWKMNGSYQGIADLFSGLFGMNGCARSTIQHARDGAADMMEPEAEGIAAEMISGSDPVGIDETPVGRPGGTGRVWLASDRNATLAKVAASRSEAVLHEHFPMFHRPLTADGYQPYTKLFGTLQRCWAHILRESDRHVRAVKKRADISQTDCRDAEERHARLQLVYHQAKEAGAATPGQCGVFVQQTVQIAGTYPEKLANKITSAAPHLFTFLLHPGMQPTNNHTERELRPIVLRRKVSGQICSVDGMRRFGILFTCLLTWRKRKLDMYGELDRIMLTKA